MTDLEKKLLPWQHAPWQALIARLRAGRLPHALLLSGARGLGKRHFAGAFAQAVLCTQPHADGLACRQCRSCLLYRAGNHPDLHVLQPAEEGKAILIDQMREMNAAVALKSQYGGYKIVIIAPAEQMNVAAANSLLKTLEEPPAQSLLLLVTHQAGTLPLTVRSRCQTVPFARPDPQIALSWLKAQLGTDADATELLAAADGAPLHALALAEGGTLARRKAMLADFGKLVQNQADPVAVAGAWLEGTPVEQALANLQSWCMDMIRLRSAARPPVLANAGAAQSLYALAARFRLTDLYRRFDETSEALRLVPRQANAQLLLEDVLLSWCGATKQ